LIISLVLQGIDATILLRKTPDSRWHGVKMQRPWTTMFCGLLLIAAVIVISGYSSMNLPADITSKVWMFRMDEGAESGRVCEARVNAPGLRGMFIAWMDGLLQSWGAVYDGIGNSWTSSSK
jgi:hypothetical protein